MSYKLMALCLVINAALATAQIPNSGFEKWETVNVHGRTIDMVEGWSTSNLTNVFSNDPEMAEKTTDAYEGQYALQLTNKPNTKNIGAMAYSSSLSSLQGNNDRFPLNIKVANLSGYYKYSYKAAHDSCSIFVVLFRKGKSIAYGEFTTGTATASYTPFNIQINYYTSDTPDSASINMYTTSHGFKEGSVLTVDALSFSGINTGLSETTQIKAMQASVFPNPSAGRSTIEFEQLAPGKTRIMVYNILGTASIELTGNQTFLKGTNSIEWNTSDLPAGIYFVRIIQSDTEKTIRVTVN